tara:strand:- start:656 stop:1813 length:1158 start_codon:yes stop_codon:yes gene_type:complete
MDNIFVINDNRKLSSFSKNTFSNYSKKESIKLFENNLILCKHRDACFIGVELHLSLYSNIIFEKLFYVSTLYTNIEYPNISNKLFQLYLKYNKIIVNKKIDYRNSQEVRNILSNMISIVSISPKNNNFQLGILSKLNLLDFEPFMLRKNIKSSNLELTKDMFFLEDSKEFILVLNEIATLIRDDTDNSTKIFYWISWLVEFEKKSKKENYELVLKPKKIENISEKNSIYWEWNLWNIILNETHYRNNNELYNQIFALYNFYKFNFKKSSRNNYLNYIFHSIYLLKKQIDFSKNPLEKKYDLIIQSILGNNFFYKTIFEKLDKKYYIEEDKIIKDTLKDDVIKQRIKKDSSKTINDKNPSTQKIILSKKAIEEKEMKKRMQYLFFN